MDWEKAPAFGRRETLLRALRRLYDLYPTGACVVETGTLRSEAGLSGDGWSTVAWGWFCHATGGRLHTVDINTDCLAVCRQVTAPYAAAIEYVRSDSAKFLRRWAAEKRGPIHLLYQDSLDYTDPTASEAHHLAEAEAALPSLAPVSLVLFDDSHAEPAADEASGWRRGGKGARAIPFLLKHGFQVEWSEGGQVLLSRGVVQKQQKEDEHGTLAGA